MHVENCEKYTHKCDDWIPFLGHDWYFKLVYTTQIALVNQNFLSTWKLKNFKLNNRAVSCKIATQGCQIPKHERQPLVSENLCTGTSINFIFLPEMNLSFLKLFEDFSPKDVIFRQNFIAQTNGEYCKRVSEQDYILCHDKCPFKC